MAYIVRKLHPSNSSPPTARDHHMSLPGKSPATSPIDTIAMPGPMAQPVPLGYPREFPPVRPETDSAPSAPEEAYPLTKKYSKYSKMAESALFDSLLRGRIYASQTSREAGSALHEARERLNSYRLLTQYKMRTGAKVENEDLLEKGLLTCDRALASSPSKWIVTRILGIIAQLLVRPKFAKLAFMVSKDSQLRIASHIDSASTFIDLGHETPNFAEAAEIYRIALIQVEKAEELNSRKNEKLLKTISDLKCYINQQIASAKYDARLSEASREVMEACPMESSNPKGAGETYVQVLRDICKMPKSKETSWWREINECAKERLSNVVAEMVKAAYSLEESNNQATARQMYDQIAELLRKIPESEHQPWHEDSVKWVNDQLKKVNYQLAVNSKLWESRVEEASKGMPG
jgi:hypothetical protein